MVARGDIYFYIENIARIGFSNVENPISCWSSTLDAQYSVKCK